MVPALNFELVSMFLKSSQIRIAHLIVSPVASRDVCSSLTVASVELNAVSFAGMSTVAESMSVMM